MVELSPANFFHQKFIEAGMGRINIVQRSLFKTAAIFCLICVSTPLFPQANIAFYSTRTVGLPVKSVAVHLTAFRDSLAGDTIYQALSENDYPVSYHRKIRTSVCFDNKCRLLNIVVYWNITGRYLGFELPSGEFLSKAEHKPFRHSEYARLHSLLVEPHSPLADIAYNELVPVKSEMMTGIDAVSAPTSRNLLAFVVEGAAYTTYKLWHIVYGNSVEEVSRLTVNALTPQLFLLILRGPDIADKIWALNHRYCLRKSSDEVQKEILSLVVSDQFSLAERAIHAIDSADMQDQDFQIALLATLERANYSLKKSIIQKFVITRQMNPAVRIGLAEKLPTMNGDLVASVLTVFSEGQIGDLEIYRHVAKLLGNANVFISHQAFKYLSGAGVKDQTLIRELEKYRRKHHL